MFQATDMVELSIRHEWYRQKRILYDNPILQDKEKLDLVSDGTPFLGATTTESVSGAFFGGAVNEIVAPSEAGGVFTVNGENGNIIYGIFAADGR